ncbi:MAG: pyridoxal-phosphate dependent enzyme [Candidatus Woesebacteria bacterium]
MSTAEMLLSRETTPKSAEQWRDFAEKHVHEVAAITPSELLETTPSGIELYGKLESYQSVGSFKLRGAYICALGIRQTNPEQFYNGLVSASAGNHAQGVALAADKLHTSSTIFMPEGTPAVKIKAVEALGGQVAIFGQTFDEALVAAQDYAQDKNGAFLHAFDNEAVIAGQGTIGTEVLDQIPDVDTIVVQIGGGGLLAGIAESVKSRRPDINIIGAQLERCDAMAQSVQGSKPIKLPRVNKIADGIAVQQPGQRTFATISNPSYVDDIITITERDLGLAIDAFAGNRGEIAEPAGLVGYAAMRKLAQNPPNNLGKKWISVISGRNADENRVMWLLETAGINLQ